MYFKDHPPPHFHVIYNEHRAVLRVDDLRLIDGRLPKRVLSLVLEWAFQHRQELQATWDELQSTGERRTIPSLE